MRDAVASVGSPLSATWCRRAGSPVSTTWLGPPPAWWISARTARTFSVPCVITTLTDSVEMPVSPSSASLLSACTSIGCWRSVDFAEAGAAASASSRPAASAVRAERSAGYITSFHLGEQLEALGFHVRAQAGAGEYRFALRDGHPMLGAGLLEVRQHDQSRGLHPRSRAVGIRRTDQPDVAHEMHLL